MSTSLCNGMIILRLRLSDHVWETIPSGRSELLHIFYRLCVSDYKNAVKHVDKLDAAVKQDSNMYQLTLEFNALNQSLSPSDLLSRERSALSARQARFQGQLTLITTTTSSTATGNDSFEPT
ncbi:hypothetical protein CRYUN_Cryun02cG0218100 [Craigia yunnanensis]